MEPLVSEHAGPPVYLTRHMDRAGLDAYEKEIEGLLARCPALAGRVRRADKVETIATCLRGVLADIGLARSLMA